MKKLLLSAFSLVSIFGTAQYVDMLKPATSYTLEETKNFQSFPGATNLVYLNITGYYVYKNEPQHVGK